MAGNLPHGTMRGHGTRPAGWLTRGKSLFKASVLPSTIVASAGDFLTPKGGWLALVALGVAAVIGIIVLERKLGHVWHRARKTRRDVRLVHRYLERRWWFQALNSEIDASWWFDDQKFWKQHGVHVLVLFAGTCFITATYSKASADQGGVLASKFEPIAALQRQVGLTEQIARDTREIKETVADIRQNMKRETSDNPRKELQNMGVAWKVSEFDQALRISDKQVAKLFLEGGMPFGRTELDILLRYFSREIGDMVIRSGSFSTAELCKVNRDMDFFYEAALKSDEKAAFLKTLCSTPATRAEVSKLVDDLHSSANAEHQKLQQRESLLAQCVARIRRDLPPQKMFAEAAALGPLSRQTFRSAEEVAKAKLYPQILAGRADQGAYETAVRAGCESETQPGTDATKRLDAWKRIQAAIFN